MAVIHSAPTMCQFFILLHPHKNLARQTFSSPFYRRGNEAPRVKVTCPANCQGQDWNTRLSGMKAFPYPKPPSESLSPSFLPIYVQCVCCILKLVLSIQIIQRHILLFRKIKALCVILYQALLPSPKYPHRESVLDVIPVFILCIYIHFSTCIGNKQYCGMLLFYFT